MYIHLVLPVFAIVLGLDILRVMKRARVAGVDAKWLVVAFAGALVAVLLAIGLLFYYQYNEIISYFIISAVVLVWVTFSSVVCSLLDIVGAAQLTVK